MSRERQSIQFLGNSDEAKEIRKMVSMVASSSSTVLITGESGTGKEVIARLLHDQSNRSAGSFVPLNCAAIPKDLLESELFGHRKGSFTGAITDRVGRFEMAHGGTIFLDEIGDMSMDMQVKLLRVLQERSIDPVGGMRSVDVDVRVIAATHRDLELEIRNGNFREDLYYRLNVLPLKTPALRIRPSDIGLLIDHFAQKFSSLGSKPVSFSPDFINILQAYAWPGNVRELSNLMDRFSTLFAGRCLEFQDVPHNFLPKALADLQTESGLANLHGFLNQNEDNLVVSTEIFESELSSESDIEDIIMLAQGTPVLPPGGVSFKKVVADFEKDLISQALNRTDGNVSKTARILNLQRTTLIEKINKFDLKAHENIGK